MSKYYLTLITLLLLTSFVSGYSNVAELDDVVIYDNDYECIGQECYIYPVVLNNNSVKKEFNFTVYSDILEVTEIYEYKNWSDTNIIVPTVKNSTCINTTTTLEYNCTVNSFEEVEYNYYHWKPLKYDKHLDSKKSFKSETVKLGKYSYNKYMVVFKNILSPLLYKYDINFLDPLIDSDTYRVGEINNLWSSDINLSTSTATIFNNSLELGMVKSLSAPNYIDSYIVTDCDTWGTCNGGCIDTDLLTDGSLSTRTYCTNDWRQSDWYMNQSFDLNNKVDSLQWVFKYQGDSGVGDECSFVVGVWDYVSESWDTQFSRGCSGSCGESLQTEAQVINESLNPEYFNDGNANFRVFIGATNEGGTICSGYEFYTEEYEFDSYIESNNVYSSTIFSLNQNSSAFTCSQSSNLNSFDWNITVLSNVLSSADCDGLTTYTVDDTDTFNYTILLGGNETDSVVVDYFNLEFLFLPTPINISISSSEVDDDLTCSYDFVDYTNKTLKQDYFKWFINGSDINVTSNVLLYNYTSLSDTVICSVKVENSDNVSGNWFNSSETVLIDSKVGDIQSYSFSGGNLNTQGVLSVVINDFSGVNYCNFTYSDPDSIENTLSSDASNLSVISKTITLNKVGIWIFESVYCVDGLNNSFFNSSVGISFLVSETPSSSGGGGGGTTVQTIDYGLLGNLSIEPSTVTETVKPYSEKTGNIKIVNNGVVDKIVSLEPLLVDEDVEVFFVNFQGVRSKFLTDIEVSSDTGFSSNEVFLRYVIVSDNVTLNSVHNLSFVLTEEESGDTQLLQFNVTGVDTNTQLITAFLTEPLFEKNVCLVRNDTVIGGVDVAECVTDVNLSINSLWLIIIISLITALIIAKYLNR